uniref:Uncharacterized protein n=1 Tax=Cannabis sativa TaxID=3483 RepID=A0A803QNJ6_CANSA
MALQDKFVNDEFITKVEGTPVEDLLSRSADLISKLMTIYSRAYVVCFKDLNLLKKQNLALQEGLKKTKLDAVAKDKEVEDLEERIKILNEQVKKLEEDNTGLTRDLAAEKENEKKAYDQTVFDYIYTTLTKLPDFDFMVFRPEAVEMANALRTMSPTETQGLGGNLFFDDAKDATIAELANGARKVVDYSNAPTI